MTRRALGRSRLLIGGGAVIGLAGMLLPWWLIGRTNAAPLSGNGLEGIGIIIFLACVAMLVVIVLPFASPTGATSLDRPGVYTLLATLAVGAFIWRVFEISTFNGLRLPMDVPGLWLSGAGVLIIAWGVAVMLTERRGY